jgi:pyruvate dehydrogenase E2 component (dihydrolipoamide acetyltransferase)
MSDRVFLMPDLGEGLSEAVILEWRVKVGDLVDIDQIVVEVETAKATVEVPIPFAGTVTGLHGETGATVEVGKPLIAVTGLQGNELAGDEASAHGRYREEEQAGSGNVLVGYGTSADSPRRRRRTNAAPASAPAAQEAPSQKQHGTAVRVISPVVRALARTNGIDLTDLAATVPGGVITRADVEHATASRLQPTGLVHTSQDDRVVAISGFRKAVADKLSTSRREIPDATTWVDVDASALFVARAAINAAVTDDEKVSLMALLARLTIAALRLFPELNSTVDTDRDEITYHGAVHLGVATQTPRGLMVPVIHNAGEMSTVELGLALKATTELARNGKLGPDRLSGGTFTLNNYGVFGVDGSTPIINHPEAAIVGVGRIIDKPWVYEGALSVRKVTQLSLSFDHRVCDGGTAGGFLRLFADFVENPVAALGRI